MRALLLIVQILLFGSCAAAGPAAAAATGWNVAAGRVFLHSTAPGLGSATSMAQDAAGFLWLGTQTGLVRWDGYREHDYVPDPSTPGKLPDSYVRALLIDGAGQMWIGTNAGGLARYLPASDSFAPVADPAGVVGPEAAALAQRQGGGLWVGGGRGLAWLDPASGQLRREPLPDGVGGVRCLLESPDGTLWVGSSAGLFVRDHGSTEFQEVVLPTVGPGRVGVTQLLQDSTGRLWVGTRLHGAYTVAAGAHAARQLPQRDTGDLSHDSVLALMDAGNGEVWIGTYGAGIVRVDLVSGRAMRESHDPGRPSSLQDDSVGALLRGRDGLVWAATSHGLSRYDTRYDAVATLYAGPRAPVRGTGVPAIMATASGAVWMATGEQGLEILDPRTGRVTALRADPERPLTTLPRARVIALAMGGDGSAWIGTQGGLYRAAADGSLVERVDVPGRAPNAETWALLFDGTALWLGGPDGLWCLDVARAPTPAVRRHCEVQLGHARVSALARGAHGELWVGTNGGLFGLDPARTTLREVPVDPRDAGALPGGMISSLLVDALGRLWVATYGHGVQVEAGRRADGSLRFRRLSRRDGLPHDGVDALVADTTGAIWASTDDGLARIDPASFHVRAIRAAQGDGISVFWTGAAARTPGGELVFGGEGGVVAVDPQRLRPEMPVLPPPVVTGALIGERETSASRLALDRAIHVPAAARRVEVEFASLVFVDQDRLRYAYQLEGFDSDWIETTAALRLATYTNLPAGHYTLALRVAPATGAWSAPLDLPFEVAPRWYERLDVRAAAAMLLLLALFGALQLRTAVLRRGKRRLAALVDERTAALARTTDELRRSQKQLEQLAYYDALTGLANRRLFNEELRRLIADTRRGGGGFVLVLIDLDHFKQVNDSFGHDVGDALLVATAKRLGDAIRAGDRALRLGGDEFAVLMRGVAADAALDGACRRIGQRLAEPLSRPGGATLEVRASLGVARFPQDADTAEALYKAADSALYAAKRAGRAQWRHADAHVDTPVADSPAPAR